MKIDINLILNRIKFTKDLKSETDLAKYLEITTARLANWRSRGTIDWDIVLTKCEDMDFNYLLKGDSIITDLPIEVEKLKSEKEYFFKRVLDLEREISHLKSKMVG